MNRTPRTFAILAVLAVLALSSLACAFGGITLGGDTASITVRVTEDQLNRMMDRSDVNVDSNSDDVLFDRVTDIEFHDGFVRVFGEAEQVSGSYDVSFSAADDVLQAQIIAVDVPGVSLDDPRIVKANADLTRELGEMLTESNGEVRIKEATVTESELELRVELLMDNNNR
jgi:hypothetical protein